MILILDLQARQPSEPGQATGHQTRSLYRCLLFTDFDFTKSGPDLLKVTESSSSDSHLFSQRRGIVNAESPCTEREASGSPPKLWRQKTDRQQALAG